MSTLKSICLLICFLANCIVADENFTVTPITTSSGLYYEKIGEVLLANNNWEFVTSVDYEGYLLFYEYLFIQAGKIQLFCEKVAIEECNSVYDSIRSNLKRIEETDEYMANFLGISTKNRRVKRFWGAIGNFFKSVGRGIVGVAQTIFGGGSSQADLSGYDRQLGDLRSRQNDMQNELNLQRTMFKVESERRNMQIEWLTKTQDEIKDKVGDLEVKFEKDSEKKEQQIKELNNMMDEVQEKLNKHEEIQRKLVGQVDEIEKTLLKVHEDIKFINEKIENNTKRIDELEVIGKLNTISINFAFLMIQFESEQKTLFEVIKNANKGNLDPYIVTPLNLIEMLQDIYPHLPDQMKFPFYPNIENANKLYNIINPSVYLYNNKIIFILKIPVVHSRIYNFHKITSLPLSLGDNKFAFILPQEPFLIIDNNYQEYMLMSSDDLKDFCKEISKNTYLCKQIHQISLVHSSQECEVTLFKTAKNIPNSCDTRLMSLDKPVFLQLQQTKSWIYAIPDTETVIFNCGSQRTIKNLEGVGFIKLNGDCTVRTSNFFIVPLVEFSKPVEYNYSSPVNLSKFIDMSKVKKTEIKSTVHQQILLPYDFGELNKISASLKRSNTNLGALHYSLMGLAVVLLLVLTFFAYKKKHHLNRVLSRIRKRNTSPAASSPNNEDAEALQIKLKVNKNSNRNIRKMSIREVPSASDPDASYVTVRVKVKNDQEAKLNNKEDTGETLKLIKNDLPPPYLNDLKNINRDEKKPKLINKDAPQPPFLQELKIVHSNKD